MIRELKSFELSLIAEGGEAFSNEAKNPGGFNIDAFSKFWSNLIDDRCGVIIGSFDGSVITGALGAVMCPDMFNGDLMAVEAFWYVLKKYRGHGIRLLFAFEDWAKNNKAARVAMIHLEHLHPVELRKLYEKLGYRLIETHYVKDL